LINLLLEVN